MDGNKPLPVDKVILQRVNHEAVGASSMIIMIPPTYDDNNILVALMRAIRSQYPLSYSTFLVSIEAETNAPAGRAVKVKKEVTDATPN